MHQSAPNESNELLFNDTSFRKARYLIKALDHELRRRIIELIHSHNEMTVTSLYITLRAEQSVTSQHLGILRRNGYVKTRREGKNIYYSVNYQRLEEVQRIIREFLSQ